MDKKWWESRGVWGGVVALVLGILKTTGWIKGIENIQVEQAVDVAVNVAIALAGALALYGRVKAKGPIQ